MTTYSDFAPERVAQIQEALGFVDECPPCNIVGALDALVSLHEEEPDFDVSLLTEEMPDDTEPSEWMDRIRKTVTACDREAVDCNTAVLIQEALEAKLEELGEPYARAESSGAGAGEVSEISVEDSLVP